QSDNNYDYLSVEEKECLMFLEETIGSLDAEGDSGVSTDDTDYGEPSKPRKGPSRDGSEQGWIRAGMDQSRAGSEQGGIRAGRDQSRDGSEESGQPWVPFLSRAGPGGVRAVLCPCVTPAPLSPGLGNGTPPVSRDQQHGAAQSGHSIPAWSSPPRNVPDPAGNGASGSKGNVPTVPAGHPAQELPKEGQGSAGSHSRSVISQPPESSQDELERSLSHHRSDAKGEVAKETKIWTSWGHPEKSTLEEAPQDPDAKRGPPTAPKPRRLPPNIILKSSRNSPVPLATEHSQKVKAAPPPSATSRPSPASDSTAEKGNSGHLDPKEKEKARREALQKLGLSQDRREPGAHLPAHPGQGSGPGLRHIAFKSNTLERSGVGLGSALGSSKEQNGRSSSSSLGKMSFMERLAPSFLRSRPRPASLGPGKDLAGLKEQEEKDKSSKRRSHPLPGFPRPPRSAVSVKISPKGAPDENRREALKKLGLLKE
ncbi:SARG protein, partial [Dicaeum eximium]|nr:SARG protein [Dicaeum eximium]